MAMPFNRLAFSEVYQGAPQDLICTFLTLATSPIPAVRTIPHFITVALARFQGTMHIHVCQLDGTYKHGLHRLSWPWSRIISFTLVIIGPYIRSQENPSFWGWYCALRWRLDSLKPILKHCPISLNLDHGAKSNWRWLFWAQDHLRHQCPLQIPDWGLWTACQRSHGIPRVSSSMGGRYLVWWFPHLWVSRSSTTSRQKQASSFSTWSDSSAYHATDGHNSDRG